MARHHPHKSRPAQGPRQRRPLQSNVGRRFDRNARFTALVRETFSYCVREAEILNYPVCGMTLAFSREISQNFGIFIFLRFPQEIPLHEDTHYPSNLTRFRTRFLPIVWKYSLVTPFATGCFVIANMVCSLFANCTPSIKFHSVAIFAIFFHQY